MTTIGVTSEAHVFARAEWQAKRSRGSMLDRALSRPDFGVVIAAVRVYVFFAVSAPYVLMDRVTGNVLSSWASLCIIAVGVAMLMIAGRFDLSVGLVYGLSSALVIMSLDAGVRAPIALPTVAPVDLATGIINGLLSGLGVILIAHNTSHAHEVCDRFAVLFHGRVAEIAERESRDFGMLPERDIITGPAVIDKDNVGKAGLA